jgi:hypothetical protein
MMKTYLLDGAGQFLNALLYVTRRHDPRHANAHQRDHVTAGPLPSRSSSSFYTKKPALIEVPGVEAQGRSSCPTCVRQKCEPKFSRPLYYFTGTSTAFFLVIV